MFIKPFLPWIIDESPYEPISTSFSIWNLYKPFIA